MKKVLQTLLLFVLVLSFTNCTITKRSYRSGYHVSWKKNNKTNQESSETKEQDVLAEVMRVEKEEIKTSDLSKTVKNEDKTKETDQKTAISAQKKTKEDKRATKSESRIEAFKKLLPLEQIEKLDDEEPEKEPEPMDAVDVLMIILGVIAFGIMAVPLFLIGYLVYILITEGLGLVGSGPTSPSTEWFGILAAGLIYMLGSWFILLAFFPKKNATEQEKRDRVFVKAIIAAVLGILGALLLLLIVI